MTKLAYWSIGLVISFLVQSMQAGTFPDCREKPAAGWTGPVFQLSQEYPINLPAPEAYPWLKFDFRTEWRQYMKAVLDYCIEGNEEVDWVVQKNTKRHWYHAPWLHWGRNGREFIHGLTYERVAQPGELAQSQVSTFQNWAVGVYNAPGGYTIGRVWRDPNAPDSNGVLFPEGTVSIKLLFTSATIDEVPYLKGSKEWDANTYDTVVIPTNPQGRRRIQKLRLLQIDIAVRDKRADTTTGWVFGTFTFNGQTPGKSLWDHIVPVGLMWGNDPGITVQMTRTGTTLKETIINPSPELPFQHLGWAGRLNGPVDNPVSSCISCHSTAQWRAASPLVPPRTTIPDSPQWLTWFRNVKAGEPFTPGAKSLDFSLQLAAGIQNFYEYEDQTKTKGGTITTPPPTVIAAAPAASRVPSGAQGFAPSLPAAATARVAQELPNYPISRGGEE
jgi:hypothetical protein